ncbi:MAG: hypothetical protein M3371_13000 [Acidobacteriota bacterium]|nr:hypothetical protein [Acidobacteriota bacterium]
MRKVKTEPLRLRLPSPCAEARCLSWERGRLVRQARASELTDFRLHSTSRDHARFIRARALTADEPSALPA